MQAGIRRALLGASLAAIAAGAGDLTLSGAGSITVASGLSATISESVGGSAGLTKLGAGTLILSGASTYSGATDITAGTLIAGGKGQGGSGGVRRVGAAGTHSGLLSDCRGRWARTLLPHRTICKRGSNLQA